jgi:TetR/AcrR family transcriptional regulator
MPRIIDHEKRRVEILAAALSLFEQLPFEEVTLACIAQRCHISRPTLYQYFRDKSDIFFYAIKFYTDKMQRNYYAIAGQHNVSVLVRLQTVFDTLISTLLEQKSLVMALARYYTVAYAQGRELQLQKKVKRRTIAFRRLLRQMLSQGVASGEFDCNAGHMAEVLMLMVESLFFQIGFLQQHDENVVHHMFSLVLQSLVIEV